MSVKRVLIIDDEAEIRRNLTLGLTQEEFVCTSCPNGISAIHELARSRKMGIGYNYLITDIFMPDIDGLKILKVIKKEFPELPVLVITGFGNDELKMTALAEHNTGFLDKPFEIEDLVKTLKELSPGPSTLESQKGEIPPEEMVSKEVISAYLTIRITQPELSKEIFDQLYFMDNIASCEAVRGDVDIMLLGQASSQTELEELFNKVKAIEGIEVLSMSPVERPKLDKDINKFLKEYQDLVKASPDQSIREHRGTTSYLFIDIDPEEIQNIFTTVFFIDEVIFCDVIEKGTKLVGMVYGGDTAQNDRVIDKLKQVDGILRVREAKIIKMNDM